MYLESRERIGIALLCFSERIKFPLISYSSISPVSNPFLVERSASSSENSGASVGPASVHFSFNSVSLLMILQNSGAK